MFVTIFFFDIATMKKTYLAQKLIEHKLSFLSSTCNSWNYYYVVACFNQIISIIQLGRRFVYLLFWWESRIRHTILLVRIPHMPEM